MQEAPGLLRGRGSETGTQGLKIHTDTQRAWRGKNGSRIGVSLLEWRIGRDDAMGEKSWPCGLRLFGRHGRFKLSWSTRITLMRILLIVPFVSCMLKINDAELTLQTRTLLQAEVEILVPKSRGKK